MTPDAANLLLGAGIVRFARGFQSDVLKREYRHLGNAESFATSTAVETVEKKSSMEGARGLLKSVVIGSETEVVVTLSEYDPENLALALLGDTAFFNQTAAPGLVAQPINGGVAIKFDRWYNMNKVALSNVVVKQGANTLVLNADYEIDLENGLLRIIEAGALSAESITTWDGDAAAVTNRPVARIQSVGTIEGSLLYIAALDQTGPRYRVELHKVTLNPDGELPFIGEAFGAITLRGKAQKDTTKAAAEQIGTAHKL